MMNAAVFLDRRREFGPANFPPAMNHRTFARVVIAVIVGTGVGWCLAARAQTPSPTPLPSQTRSVNINRATGTFDVKLVPLPADEKDGPAVVGRMSIDKQFHGDLEGTSKGEMLMAGTEVKGSAGYVAMERVTGTLEGKKGSFLLQHSGSMNRGMPELSVIVVPDSGTGELVGLAGTFSIVIADGKHSYEFNYSLPKAP
jgi:hypothetical protein